MAKERKYSDFNMNFIAHPNTKDVAKVKDEEAIKQAVKNIVLTNFYDRPFRPWLGSHIRAMLFEPVTPLTAIIIEDRIKEVIEENEPRAALRTVIVEEQYDGNGYDVEIEFDVVHTEFPVVLEFILKRL